MKKLLLLYFLFGCLTNSFSQSITGTVTNIFGEPLTGANVKWKGQEIGTATDSNGAYKIQNFEGETRVLIFSYLGFKTDSIRVGELTQWNIQLIEDNTLSTVDISARKQATRFADGVIKAEVLGTRELERAACCSLAGCFNTNASVDAATTNVVTDAKELRILGLSGVYNQILIDGMPLVQGTSYTFGSSSIPGTMIEEIFVSKGANSVVQGYESITGQINIMPKSPAKSEILFLNGLVNSFGESHYNVNYMHKKSNWSNFTNVHATLPAGTVDGDGDGFQDVAQVSRVAVFNKWIYDNPDNQKFSSQIGLRFWDENRIGGQTEYKKDIHRGSGEIYGQQIDLTQFDAYAKINYKLGSLTSIIWESSAFQHDQESIYGQKVYKANQTNIYSNLVLDHNFGANQHNWKTGISIRENDLFENISFIENPLNLSYEGNYINDYTIPGLFTEAIFYVNNFTIMGGIRADKHGDFGWKITPRMLIRAEVNENTDIRFSAGKGFRRVHPFSEQVMMLASNRDITFEEELAPEEAINLGLNVIQRFRFGDITSSLVVDGYLTFFQNQVFPDFDREVGEIFINNFGDKSYSRNIQVENKWEFSPQFDFKWAYNYQWTAREIEGKMVRLPLIPLHNLMSQISMSTKDNLWQADFTFKWTGIKQLPETQDYPVQYQQADNSPSYSRVDLQLTRRWNRFELYTGIENITNFRQNFPILGSDDPFGPFFDSSFNWGPTKGREFYLGFRYKIRQ